MWRLIGNMKNELRYKVPQWLYVYTPCCDICVLVKYGHDDHSYDRLLWKMLFQKWVVVSVVSKTAVPFTGGSIAWATNANFAWGERNSKQFFFFFRLFSVILVYDNYTVRVLLKYFVVCHRNNERNLSVRICLRYHLICLWENRIANPVVNRIESWVEYCYIPI